MADGSRGRRRSGQERLAPVDNPRLPGIVPCRAVLRTVLLKPITIVCPVVPAKDDEERAALRAIGRDRERCPAAVRGLSELIKGIHEMGVWGGAAIELPGRFLGR